MESRRVVTVAEGIEALSEWIDDRQKNEPLCPVTVLCADTVTALHVRRRLATRPGGCGLVNVRFLTRRRLAEIIGSPALDAETLAKPVLTTPIRELAVRETMVTLGGFWTDFATHPPTVTRATRSLREAERRGVMPEVLGALNEAVRPVLARFRSLDDIFEKARERLDSGAFDDFEFGPLVEWLLPGPEPTDEGFVAALARNSDLSRIELSPVKGSAATQSVRAPDSETEVAWAIGDVRARAASGTALHRIGLVYSALAYAPLVEAGVRRAGLPAHGAFAPCLDRSVPGAGVLALARVVVRDFDRDDLRDLFSDTPLISVLDRTAVPRREWCRIVRQAPVERGFEEWLRYLRARESSEDASRLALADYLVAIREKEKCGGADACTWADWVSVFRALLGFIDPRPAGSEEEIIDDYALVRLRIDGLATFATLDPKADGPEALVWLARALDVLATHRGNIGDGLFVGPLDDLGGLEFDHLHVLGMADDLFTPTPELDPFGVPPPERPSQNDAWAALAAHAPSVTISWPERSPLLRRALFPVRDAVGDEVLKVPSRPAALRERPSALADLDVRRVLRHDPVSPEAMATIDRARRRRDSLDEPVFGPYEGMVGPIPPPRLSATSLETFGGCPFRYFLERILELREEPRPESGWLPSRASLGDAWHVALERFFARHPKPRDDGKWNVAEVNELTVELNAALVELEGVASFRRGFLWEVSRERLLDGVPGLLHSEALARGEGHVASVEVTMAASVRVGERELVVNGRIDRVDLHPEAEGRVTIIDYKTGKGYKYEKLKPGRNGQHPEPTLNGRLAQLPAYALAYEQAHPERPLHRAEYWRLERDGDDLVRGIDLTRDDWRESFSRNVRVFSEMIENGYLPATTDRNGGPQCDYCPYRTVCPGDRWERWQRKKSDGRLRPLLNVFEPTEEGVVSE